MGKGITTSHGITIGLDVSDRFTEACAIDDEGEWFSRTISVSVPAAEMTLVQCVPNP